jgi:hypothetical protein
VAETVHEEWLLTFTADTDEKFFSDRFRQTVVYTINGDWFPHYAWFENELDAQMARDIAGGTSALNIRLQRRTVTTVSTDWVDVP